ncbi:MAG TPA: amidohydrolase/deacetylase family metallohydrolase [Bryobacteraceae bacterium]|nr:amidohydrolase/deacetylase family metallohydrolase [Bryobacteraceae bacterium]
MKLKEFMAGCALLGALWFGVIGAQAQTVGERTAPQGSQTPETSVPVSANAYQSPGPQGPSGCTGCFPVKPASQGPNQESGLPQAVPQGGGFGAAGQRVPRIGPPPTLPNPLPYDLLLQHGHVIDAKNNIDRVMDVAIKDGKIAAVGEHLDPKEAAKTIDVAGFYVTPGLIDIHTHDYASTGEARSYAGDYGIWPDAFTLRTGVTTVCDAGSSGWRNFEDFKEHIIDREITRVLSFINIVGAGMRGPRFEDNVDDMQMAPTGWMALRYPETIIGIKSAHFTGPEWTPYVEAVGAGNIAHVPVMIDYGANRIERPLYDLLTKYLRQGDIYTHTYSGLRGEQDTMSLGPSKAMIEGRRRGIYFDAGTGGGSFRFRVAVPLIKAGFLPDSLSTDLHADSMNSSTKDMLNVMSKFMAMGLTLQQVVTDTTWHPAQEIHRLELGNLSVGAPADVAVLSDEHGKFGFLDMDNTKLMGNTRLICQLTLRTGKVVYDLNGVSMDEWDQVHPSSNPQEATHWTTFRPRPPLPEQITPRRPMTQP